VKYLKRLKDVDTGIVCFTPIFDLSRIELKLSKLNSICSEKLSAELTILIPLRLLPIPALLNCTLPVNL